MYRRNLPHWHPPGTAVFITWRLYGSLPNARNSIKDGHAFRALDRQLDSTQTGPRWLTNPKVAQAVVETILEAASAKSLCELHAYVVMPNHIHVLVTPHSELAKVTQWLKGASARRANLILARTGQHFWQDESFDHWVRNSFEYSKIVRYIENNPVLAGLAASPESWPYSSAANRLTACATNNLEPGPQAE